jgi:hypothetical protein
MASVPDNENRTGGTQLLKSRSDAEITALKRNLVMQLYTQDGPFWEAVREVRSRRRIVANTKHSSELARRHIPLPEDEPEWPGERGEPRYSKEQEDAWHGFFRNWLADLNSVIRRVVPKRYFDPRKKDPFPWQRFVAACILHDPPETDLLAFAEYGGPYPEVVGPLYPGEGKWPEEPMLKMVEPPIVQLRDGLEERNIEAGYWWAILVRMWELHLKPHGLDLLSVLNDIHEKYPEIEKERHERAKENKLRSYIRVYEHTNENDVRGAFRMLSAMHEERPEAARPKRDPLIGLQCAILYDRHNSADPKDKRRLKWTYERLAEEFGLGSGRAAKGHVDLGRQILKRKNR